MGLSPYRECTYCGTSNTATSLACVSCGALLSEEGALVAHDDGHEIPFPAPYASGLSSLEPLSMQSPPISLLDFDSDAHTEVYDEVSAAPSSGGMQQQLHSFQKMSAHSSAKRSLSRRKLLFGAAGVALAGGWLLAYQSSRPALLPAMISQPPMSLPTPLGAENGLPVTEKFSVAWSPDGHYLGLTSAGGTLQIKDGTTYATLFDASSNTPGVDDVSTAINSLSWLPTNSSAFACACDDGTVQIRQVPQGTVSQLYREHTSSVQAVSWRHDGKYIASADLVPLVNVWDATSLNTLTSYAGDTFNGQVTSLSWSPDGNLLACACMDSKVSILNLAKEQPDLIYTKHQLSVEAVAWSPDGRYLASAGDDSSVHVWQPQTGEPVAIYSQHTDKVWCLAWSPDSQFLASGSWDKTVCIWKIGENQPYQTFTQPQDRVVSLDWSKQGRIVVVDATGTLLFWNLDHSSPLKQA